MPLPQPSPSPPLPAAVPAAGRRAARVVGDVLLGTAGMLVSTVALANVPGGMRITSDGSAEATNMTVLLWLVVALLWTAVFLRRGAPLVPLVAGGILAAIGVDYLLLLVGTFHAVLSWPRRAARIASGASVAVVALFVVREIVTGWGGALDVVLAGTASADGTAADAAAFDLVRVVLAAASLLVALGLAVLVRVRREGAADRDRADHEGRRAATLGEQVARQAERDRLARDIHDALAHRLSVISLHSGALEAAAEDQDPAVRRAAQTLRQQAHASLEELRSLLGELRMERPAPADAAPPSMTSMKAIGHLVRSVREGGTALDAVVLVDDADRASVMLDRAVYRIVQESVTNALKHAPGSPVSVYVEASAATGVRIRVSNPLPTAGIAEVPGSGVGIEGVRERTRALGGEAWIGAHEGRFLLDVTLPWSERS